MDEADTVDIEETAIEVDITAVITMIAEVDTRITINPRKTDKADTDTARTNTKRIIRSIRTIR